MFVSYPKAQYLINKNKINKAIQKVLTSGHYILGREVELFEKEFAKYIGVKHAIGVANGTDALNIALVACGINKNDEVLTVSHTAVATASAIVMSKAIPRFVDIKENSFNIDPSKIEAKITKKTKAIVVVHLYGNPSEIQKILIIAKKYNLILIEDCSQAHGAKIKNKKVGSFGHAACFSFYPTKNLGAIGDGGIIISNNKKINENCRLLRNYGWKKRYISDYQGWNSRLDEMQAAILRVKLKNLDNDNKKRNKIAKYYFENLKNTSVKLPFFNKDHYHVFHLFVIKTSFRNKLLSFLKKNNVNCSIHYPVPIHKQSFYKKITKNNKLNVTEKISREIISLPIYPEMKISDIKTIIRLIKFFLNNQR